MLYRLCIWILCNFMVILLLHIKTIQKYYYNKKMHPGKGMHFDYVSRETARALTVQVCAPAKHARSPGNG